MQFIRTSDATTAVSDLSNRLISELEADQDVLWILSGGSNIDASVKIMQTIPSQLQARLTIIMVDERYGPLGHPESNFQQLIEKGFDPGSATLVPVLQAGLTLADTAIEYGTVVKTSFDTADIIIGQLGIGADGHIAGILPESAAAKDITALVTSYISEPYQRITMTFRALQALDADYTFAFGDDKQAALTKLQLNNCGLSEQPSQILKQLPEAYVYNDQLEGDPT